MNFASSLMDGNPFLGYLVAQGAFVFCLLCACTMIDWL